jgi:glycosyltransferase involved in cell wall biosynthesis
LPLLYRYEKGYSAKFSQIVVTTTDDRRQFAEFAPNGKIDVIPNGVDLELFPDRPQDPGNHRLVFAGAMDASHNIDAARFFALEVLPLLRKRYPDVTFAVVGARPVPEVMELQHNPDNPGVVVTGQVDSMSDQLHQAAVCVVPLRTGYGIKNKTLEAMAAGVPVVASDRGLEGLAVDSPDVPLRALRANRIEEYVQAISSLFDDSRLRTELSQNGRSLIETEYTWDTAGKLYEQVLSELSGS